MKRYKKRKDLTNEDFLELKNHIMAYRLLAIPHARRKYKANFDEVMIRLEIDHHFEETEYILIDYDCICRNIKALAQELQISVEEIFHLYPSFKFLPALSSYYGEEKDFGMIVITNKEDFFNMKKRLKLIYLYKPKKS